MKLLFNTSVGSPRQSPVGWRSLGATLSALYKTMSTSYQINLVVIQVSVRTNATACGRVLLGVLFIWSYPFAYTYVCPLGFRWWQRCWPRERPGPWGWWSEAHVHHLWSYSPPLCPGYCSHQASSDNSKSQSKKLYKFTGYKNHQEFCGDTWTFLSSVAVLWTIFFFLLEVPFPPIRALWSFSSFSLLTGMAKWISTGQ